MPYSYLTNAVHCQLNISPNWRKRVLEGQITNTSCFPDFRSITVMTFGLLCAGSTINTAKNTNSLKLRSLLWLWHMSRIEEKVKLVPLVYCCCKIFRSVMCWSSSTGELISLCHFPYVLNIVSIILSEGHFLIVISILMSTGLWDWKNSTC